MLFDVWRDNLRFCVLSIEFGGLIGLAARIGYVYRGS